MSKVGSNNGTSPRAPVIRAYRSRRTRPCDYCRKRKIRCDMIASDLCTRCQKSGELCTFVGQPAKKKRVSNSELTKQPSHENPTPTSYSEDSSSQHGLVIGSSSSEPPQSISELDAEPDTPSYPEFIPEKMATVSLLGFSGDQDPNLIQFFNYNEQESISFIKSAVRRVSHDPEFPVQFAAYAEERDSKYFSAKQNQLQKIKKLAGKYEERLLALYFRFVHPLYPIIDKEKFYEKLEESPEQIDPGLLSGILALSCIWWKYDSVLCVWNRPSGLSDILFDECSASIEQDYKYPTISTIQSMLLLLQRRLGPDQTALTLTSSAEVSKLVASAHSLGLHLDCSDWTISASLKQLRKKLWATIFVMEKWISANTGRPSLLSWDNSTWDVYSSDDPEEQIFVHLFGLTVILDSVCKELYSARGQIDRVRDQESTQIKVSDHWRALDRWKEALPRHISDMSATTVREGGVYCRNGPIHLAALTVEVLLLKVRLAPASFKLPMYKRYRSQASETIHKVLKFTSEIYHAHLTGFWYSCTSLNFSTIAHFIFYYHLTSLTATEHRDTKELIRKWLWTLKLLSQGWEEGTGLAYSKLESMFWTTDLVSKDLPILEQLRHRHSMTTVAAETTENESKKLNSNESFKPISQNMEFDVDAPTLRFNSDNNTDDIMDACWINNDDIMLLGEDLMSHDRTNRGFMGNNNLEMNNQKWDHFFDTSNIGYEYAN